MLGSNGAPDPELEAALVTQPQPVAQQPVPQQDQATDTHFEELLARCERFAKQHEELSSILQSSKNGLSKTHCRVICRHGSKEAFVHSPVGPSLLAKNSRIS